MPIHVGTELEADTPELEVDVVKPGITRLMIDFQPEEIERLRARHPRGPLIRFIKQAALETADRQAEAKSSETLQAAD